jgi:hypothetical protein
MLLLLPAVAAVIAGGRHRLDIATATVLVSVALGLPVLWLTWASFRDARRSDDPIDPAADQRVRLGDLLCTIADAQGLTGQEVGVLVQGWSADVVDAYLGGTQVPEWNFVVAFLAVVAGDDRWHCESLKRRVRPVWEAVAETRALSGGAPAAEKAGASVPTGTGKWVTAMRRVTSTRLMVGRLHESVGRHEVLRSALVQMVDRLSEAATLLTAERDTLMRELAARQNSALIQKPDHGMEAELGNLRIQLQDSRRRLAAAERLRVATLQRLAESEQQRLLAERLKEEAITMAEQARTRLAELEQHPPFAGPRTTADRELSAGSTTPALMGNTDKQVGDEILCRVDHVLRDEAITLDRLREDLASTLRAELVPVKTARSVRVGHLADRPVGRHVALVVMAGVLAVILDASTAAVPIATRGVTWLDQLAPMSGEISSTRAAQGVGLDGESRASLQHELVITPAQNGNTVSYELDRDYKNLNLVVAITTDAADAAATIFTVYLDGKLFLLNSQNSQPSQYFFEGLTSAQFWIVPVSGVKILQLRAEDSLGTQGPSLWMSGSLTS